MDENNMRKILFRIVVDQEHGGFSHASNFITKIVNGEEVTVEDVKGISSRLLPADVSFMWKARLLMDGISFLDIGRPERILQVIRNRECEFGMVVEDGYLQDILSIQPFVLMKMYFRSQSIFAVIQGTSSHYYPMGYFLSNVMQRREMAGSIYYYQRDKGILNKMEEDRFGKNIAAFYPLQIVDGKMLGFLKNSLGKAWSETEDAAEGFLTGFIAGNRVDWQMAPREFRGLLMKLKGMKFADWAEAREIARLLAGGRTLSFLVFAFSLRSSGEISFTDIHQLRIYYQMVDDYATGILQLIENIVFHAGSHSGIFCMRLHPPKREDYLRKKFPKTQEASYLEVSVADYQGNNACDNIATNFLANRKEEDRRLFRKLSPCDLFDFGSEGDKPDKEVEEAFRKYYSANLDNIGRHYGLKLFRDIILKNKGAFRFYSCQSHSPQEGERGGIDTEAEQELFECFPGTGYSILLPVIARENNRYAIGVDNQNEFEDFCSNMDAYRCGSCQPYHFTGEFETQEEKEKVIRDCAVWMGEKFAELQEDGKNIVYIDAGKYKEVQAELLYKAVVKLALGQKMPDVVFYHCMGNFVREFRECVTVFFEKVGFEDILAKNKFCIALYDGEDVSETLIYPGDLENTYRANLLTAYTQSKDWLENLAGHRKKFIQNSRYARIPYDILLEAEGENGRETIFEQYVKIILDKNIQGKEFGCKLENVHMRLGSTIHVSTFYEAELLFSNRYFVSRFAMMMAWEISRKFGSLTQEEQRNLKLTFCAYGMYSELLVFRTMEVLRHIYRFAGEDGMDYAILEREPIAHQWQHKDTFRYSVAFKSDEERKKHWQERKMVSIVPINSTLKTQDKLLEMFCRENGVTTQDFVMNFSLILVGEAQGNKYWKLDEKEKVCIPGEKKTMVSPNPRYYVQMPIPYYEANRCMLCYPENVLLEKPLVEVNAYSTVPNQAIGLWKEEHVLLGEQDYHDAFLKGDEELGKLYHSLVYSHINRNGNHFLYYFRTEKLFLEQKEDIRNWLLEKSSLIEKEDMQSVNTYHILFCPVHCSNTGFLEYVNRYVFHDAALVIRLDVNKEYRSNLKTKYSNLGLLIENMGQDSKTRYTISTHFIDDCIVTGKTVRRMQSLAQSILSDHAGGYENVDVVVFERIFVLIDRNSVQSKQQYLSNMTGKTGEDELARRYFSYIKLNISSIRNHGDSCNICQLERESEVLAQTSSTRAMMKYWKNRQKVFEPKSVEKYDEGQHLKRNGEEGDTKARNYRRMYCCHMATGLLNEKYHGNKPELVRICMLRLLLQDLIYREDKEDKEKEQFEYFLSYLKVLSRPFLVYQKPVKEAVFTLLLILVQWQLEMEGEFGKKGMEDIMDCVWGKEKGRDELRVLLREIGSRIIPLLDTVARKRDFLLVCMKQLMEMKSNYFLRRQNIKELTSYIADWGGESRVVYERYLRYVKKLIGANTDTSKSTWLSEEIKQLAFENNSEEYLPKNVMDQLIVENNRTYYEGVDRLSQEKKVQGAKDVQERISTLRYQYFQAYLDNNTEVDSETIWNSIRLVRYLRDEFSQILLLEEKTRKKYYDIAEIACDILGAEKVYMLMATPLECEQWRYELKKELKAVHDILFPEEIFEGKAEAEKKEYLVVSISGEHETVLEVPISVIEDVERFEAGNSSHYVDDERGHFIWKLGMEEGHPIIIYAKFPEKTGNNLLYRCTKLMIMNNLLNETAFSSNAVHYLYEIVTAESNAIKLSYYKSFSHTPEDIRKQQYSDVIMADREKYFQSHVITLLSDLRISENYRAGLKREYYANRLGIWYGKLLGDRSVLGKINDLYVVDGMTQKHVKIEIRWKELAMENGEQVIKTDTLVPEEQEIAFKGYANGMDDLLLLVMALIENAASKGKAESKGEENIVRVYLSKTESGNLRILNEVCETGDLEKIRFFMSRPPQPKDGISIWSISRYLLSMECSIIRGKIKKMNQYFEKGADNASQNRESVVNLYYETENRLEHLPETRVAYVEAGEKNYFSIELPVMAENYREVSREKMDYSGRQTMGYDRFYIGDGTES